MLPLAVRTGLEPATPGVTGRYSNQLNYRTICSVLCVFLERGCKGTHFFETCKFFRQKMQKKFKKSDGGPVEENRHRMLTKPKPMKTNMLSILLNYFTSITLFSGSVTSFCSFGMHTLSTPFSTFAPIFSLSAFSGRIRV